MTRELKFAHAKGARTNLHSDGRLGGGRGGRAEGFCDIDTMAAPPRMVFHEQQAAKLSGRHAVNNLLQGPYVTEFDLAAIARELDAAERQLVLANGAETAEALRYMAKDSDNVDESGNFSLSVVREALARAAGAELIQNGAEVERVLADPSCAEALLLLSKDDHFRALRRLPSGAAESASDASTEAWFDLDSELARPEVVRLLDFKPFLLDLRAKCNSIFVVRVPGGRLPAPQLGRVATDAICRWYAARELVAENNSGRAGSAYVGGGEGAGGAAAAPAALPQASSRIAWSDIKFEKDESDERIVIGAGGSTGAIVYAAKVRGVVDVAVKTLVVHGAAPGVVEAFWRESGIHFNMHHDGIVPCLGAAEREQKGAVAEVALVMQRMTGGTLASWTAPASTQPLAARLRALHEVALALVYMHAFDTVHGDLKPANVLLDAEGRARLADFGTARLRAATSETRNSLRGERGTPLYMDPALGAAGGSLRPASDIYSFAVLAWELLTRKVPFADLLAGGAGVEALRVHVRAGGRPSPEDLLPVVGAALTSLLQRAWDADPLRRPGAAEVAEVIGRVCAELGPEPALPWQGPHGPWSEPYEAGPGLALLFADKREARFISGCDRLAHVLALCGYEVRSFDATDVLTHVRVEVAAALKRLPNLSRVVVAYRGHGCMSAAHPMGLLCGQGLDSQSFVRVAELEAVASAAVIHAAPRAIPRLLLLDCCYSHYGGGVPPPWAIDPASDSVHDSAILRAASEGHYGYSSEGWSLSHCVADVLETTDGLSLEGLKFAIAPRMKLMSEIEPKLELKMSRPFLFSRGGGARVRR
jgi:hypothetical protein